MRYGTAVTGCPPMWCSLYSLSECCAQASTAQSTVQYRSVCFFFAVRRRGMAGASDSNDASLPMSAAESAQYLAEHAVLQRINMAISDAVRHRAPNPLQHMANFLRQPHPVATAAQSLAAPVAAAATATGSVMADNSALGSCTSTASSIAAAAATAPAAATTTSSVTASSAAAAADTAATVPTALSCRKQMPPMLRLAAALKASQASLRPLPRRAIRRAMWPQRRRRPCHLECSGRAASTSLPGSSVNRGWIWVCGVLLAASRCATSSPRSTRQSARCASRRPMARAASHRR